MGALLSHRETLNEPVLEIKGFSGGLILSADLDELKRPGRSLLLTGKLCCEF